MLLGDVYASNNKFEEAFKLYDFIQSGYLKMFGTNETVLNSYVHQQRCEASIKMATERDLKPLEKAVEEAKTAVEIMEKITGKTEEKDVNNYLTSLRI